MRTLVIPDIHEPVTHPGAMDFIDSVAQDFGPDRIVFIGDVVDHHGISFWTKHPNAPGQKDEYELAKAGVQRWHDRHPMADVCIGNHDERPIRVAEKAGVGGAYLKEYAIVWETPGWTWAEEFLYEDILFVHGTGRSGLNPAANLAKEISMSAVMGHVHSTLGIKWFANPTKRWFGMDVGCLIDDRLYAFAYGKRQKKRSVLGCGVIDSIDPMQTRVIAMPAGRGETFDRRRYKIHPLLEGRLG